MIVSWIERPSIMLAHENDPGNMSLNGLRSRRALEGARETLRAGLSGGPQAASRTSAMLQRDELADLRTLTSLVCAKQRSDIFSFTTASHSPALSKTSGLIDLVSR